MALKHLKPKVRQTTLAGALRIKKENPEAYWAFLDEKTENIYVPKEQNWPEVVQQYNSRNDQDLIVVLCNGPARRQIKKPYK